MRKLLAALIVLQLALCAFVETEAQTICCFDQYVSLPAGLTLSSPTTIIPSQTCCGNGTYNFTLVGNPANGGNVTPNGNFDHGFAARQFDGTAGHEYYFQPTAGTILGGASGTEHGFGVLDHGNYFRLQGLSATQPGVSKGQFGVYLAPSTGGANHKVINWVGKGTTAGAYQANGDSTGGANYDSLYYRFIRQLNGSAEFFYIGKTSSGGARIKYLYIHHGYSGVSGREPGQIRGVANADISNITGILPGQEGTSGQQFAFQVENCNGSWNYSIFDRAVNGPSIFTHGFTMQYIYVSWTGAVGVVGRTDSQNFYPSPLLTGDTIRIDHWCFKKIGTADPYALLLQERIAPIKVTNSVFDNCATTSIFNDGRSVGYTNGPTSNFGTTSTNGNSTGTCPAPTYVTGYDDPDDYEHQGLANHYKISGVVIGYREKSPSN